MYIFQNIVYHLQREKLDFMNTAHPLYSKKLNYRKDTKYSLVYEVKYI